MSSVRLSIIIPCYNGTTFIGETLNSILSQRFTEYEILVIDDGSTDHLEEKLKEFPDPRIHYISQKNQGVSAARNKGLEHAKGEFVVFFDADDKMSDDFLMARVDDLTTKHNLQFVCGEVQKFNADGINKEYFRGTTGNAVREILLFDPEVTTCPSNYMYRRDFLVKHRLTYNTKLSSTADKLFLLQSSRHGNSDIIKGKGKLLYRVSESSMSHHYTDKLVMDNEQYYLQLQKGDLIPDELKKESLYLGNFMLAGSFWKVKKIGKAIKYGIKAFCMKPLSFLKKITGL